MEEYEFRKRKQQPESHNNPTVLPVQPETLKAIPVPALVSKATPLPNHKPEMPFLVTKSITLALNSHSKKALKVSPSYVEQNIQNAVIIKWVKQRRKHLNAQKKVFHKLLELRHTECDQEQSHTQAQDVHIFLFELYFESCEKKEKNKNKNKSIAEYQNLKNTTSKLPKNLKIHLV